MENNPNRKTKHLEQEIIFLVFFLILDNFFIREREILLERKHMYKGMRSPLREKITRGDTGHF